MHFSSQVLTTAGLLGLAAARPAIQARSVGTAKAFNLRVTQTGGTSPSVDGWSVSGARVGSGTYISQLVATDSDEPYYLNGTEAGRGTATTDIVNVYPISLLLSGPDQGDFFYPAEHDVGLSATAGTDFGVSLVDDSPSLVGLGPDGAPLGGQFAACVRPFVLGGAETELTTLRYVYEGEEVPSDCASVELRLECAALNELPADSTWTHDSALEVACMAA